METINPWMLYVNKNNGSGHWAYEVRTVAPHNPAGTIGKHIATVNPYVNPIAHGNVLAASPELLDALTILVDHAQEQYPHFENPRGQADIQRALAAISKALGK